MTLTPLYTNPLSYSCLKTHLEVNKEHGIALGVSNLIDQLQNGVLLLAGVPFWMTPFYTINHQLTTIFASQKERQIDCKCISGWFLALADSTSLVFHALTAQHIVFRWNKSILLINLSQISWIQRQPEIWTTNKAEISHNLERRRVVTWLLTYHMILSTYYSNQ